MSEKEKNTKAVKEESTKDKHLDKVFWFKVFFSVACGLIFGILSLKGFLSIIL